MHEHHGFASVQLFENWLVIRMTQPFIVVAGEESNAIRLEHTIGVLDLTEAGIGIRKGNYGEVTKAARVISHKISSVFIYSVRHSSRCLAVSVPECDRSKGENSRRNAAFVHCCDHQLRSPAQKSGIHPTAARVNDSLTILG